VREDPRQTRTRAALRAALVRLLARSSLADISVAELCREAQVHRTTFYGHADGVDSFAVDLVTRDIDEASTVQIVPEDESPEGTAARYLRSLGETLRLVAAERSVYRGLMGSGLRSAVRTGIEQRLRHHATVALEVFASQHVAGVPSDEHERAEAAAFIAGALSAVIETWALGDETDADAAGRRILHLMPRWWPVPTGSGDA
jgi:AcrR family transcriptional regulator